MNPLKFLKYLPGVSSVHWPVRDMEEGYNRGIHSLISGLKGIGHFVYASLGVTYALWGVETGEWNPIKQPQALHEARLAEQRERDESLAKLLSPFDDNRNRAIDGNELLIFLRNTPTSVSSVTLGKLERVIAHYEAQMRDRK